MKLKIKVIGRKNDPEVQESVKILKNVLRKCGISVVSASGLANEEVLSLTIDKETVAQKMKRGGGAKPKTAKVKIETILEIEKKYYRKPQEREAAFRELGIGVRRYQQIKKEICAVFGSLEQAIQHDYIYFMCPNSEEIRNFAIQKVGKIMR